MDGHRLMAIARRAADYGLRRGRWTSEERQDARAEAVLQIVRCARSYPQASDGLLWVAGLNATKMWMRAERSRRPRQMWSLDRTIEERLAVSMPRDSPNLLAWFARRRRQWHAEVAYLEWILDGYRNREIARFAGKTESAVKAIRWRIQQKLARLASR